MQKLEMSFFNTVSNRNFPRSVMYWGLNKNVRDGYLRTGTDMFIPFYYNDLYVFIGQREQTIEDGTKTAIFRYFLKCSEIN